MRFHPVLCVGLALATLTCATENTPTEPASGPSLAQATRPRTLAVHPSKNLDPEGQRVTVIGKGFPANAPVQLAECTGFLICQVVADVRTNKQGMFVTRVLVAFDLRVINPFPPVPTCSRPTFFGVTCVLAATPVIPPFQATFVPLRFSE